MLTRVDLQELMMTLERQHRLSAETELMEEEGVRRAMRELLRVVRLQVVNMLLTEMYELRSMGWK